MYYEVQAEQSRKATVRKAIGSVKAVSPIDEQPTQHPEQEAAKIQGLGCFRPFFPLLLMV